MGNNEHDYWLQGLGVSHQALSKGVGEEPQTTLAGDNGGNPPGRSSGVAIAKKRPASKDAHHLPARRLALRGHQANPAIAGGGGSDGNDGTTQMEPTVVTGDRGQFRTKAIEAAHHVSDRARVNVTLFATQVESACQAFRNYTRGKIERLEDQVTTGELLAVLSGVVLTVVGGRLAEEAASVTTRLGSEIIAAINDSITDHIGEKLKASSPESKDIDDLKQVVDQLAMAARDSATGMIDSVTRKIDPPMDSIIDALNNDQELTPDQQGLIGRFYQASNSVTDRELQSLGIPSAATAKQVQLDVYKGLVEKFQEKLILATASLRDQIEISTADYTGPENLTLHGRASRAADEAARTRAAEMDSAAGGNE